MADLKEPVPVLVERRFPLKLSEAVPALRKLYHESKSDRWDPRRDVPWDRLDTARLTPEQRAAGAATWRRRAWVEGTALIETPALVVRFCMEIGREAETHMFLTVRNTEEAWQVESCDMLARALAGEGARPPARPSTDAYATVFNRSSHRTAFDSRVSLDAQIVATCLFEDALERDLAVLHRQNAQDPAIAAVLDRMIAAKTRHAEFGRIYSAHRAPGWTQAEKAEIAERLGQHVRDVEFAGYHLPCLSSSAAAEAAADAASATAGLGAATPQAEGAVLGKVLAATRTFLDGYGVKLERLSHKALGEI